MGDDDYWIWNNPFQMNFQNFAIPDVQPLTINHPEVYSSQRINNNMTLIRKIR